MGAKCSVTWLPGFGPALAVPPINLLIRDVMACCAFSIMLGAAPSSGLTRKVFSSMVFSSPRSGEPSLLARVMITFFIRSIWSIGGSCRSLITWSQAAM